MRTGFTLVELMVIVALLGVAVSWGIPSLQALTAGLRLQAAAHDTYALLQHARYQAMLDQQPRFVLWQGSAEQWCVAISLQPDCDCRRQQCAMADGYFRLVSEAYPGVLLQRAVFAQGAYTRFDGQRGLAQAHAGSVTYQTLTAALTPSELRVVVSTLGRVRLCQLGDFSAHATC